MTLYAISRGAINMLEENGIDLDTIYECVGNEQIYWIISLVHVRDK